VRERRSAEVRSTVIDDQTPFVPLVVPRVSGELTELEHEALGAGSDRPQAVDITVPRQAGEDYHVAVQRRLTEIDCPSGNSTVRSLRQGAACCQVAARFVPDSPLEGAVYCEPVSETNFREPEYASIPIGFWAVLVS
jgi:hypothetical protein